MIKTSSKQTGSVHAIVVVVLIVALVGALGFIFWQNFLKSPESNEAAQTNQNQSSEVASEVCAGYEGAVEKNKVFCSKDIGVEFKIPDVFADKFQKKEDYDVFKGGMEDSKGVAAGKSLHYYKAVVSSGDETLSLSVAQEPLRSGYSNIGHALQRTYFNESNGNLTLVKSPVTHYDSETDTSTTTGSWSAGEPVPSFTVNSTKVYYGKSGDAGVTKEGYLVALKTGIVVIKIEHTMNPMKNPVLDADKSIADLNTYLKQLKLLD